MFKTIEEEEKNIIHSPGLGIVHDNANFHGSLAVKLTFYRKKEIVRGGKIRGTTKISIKKVSISSTSRSK